MLSSIKIPSENFGNAKTLTRVRKLRSKNTTSELYSQPSQVKTNQLDVRSSTADAVPNESLCHLVLDPGSAFDLFVFLDLGARQGDVAELLAQAARLSEAAGLQTPEDLVHVLGDVQDGGVRAEWAVLQPLNASLKHRETFQISCQKEILCYA